MLAGADDRGVEEMDSADLFWIKTRSWCFSVAQVSLADFCEGVFVDGEPACVADGYRAVVFGDDVGDSESFGERCHEFSERKKIDLVV